MQSLVSNLVSKIIIALLGGVATKYGLSDNVSALAVDAGALAAGLAAWYWSHRSILADVTGYKAGESNPNPPKGASGLVNRSLLALLLPVLAFGLMGCKTYQAVNATSGTGLKMDASIPIPYSGGQTILGLSLIGGVWKTGTVLQPTTTNAISSPSVAINMGEAATASASGTASVSGTTNGVAGLGAIDKQHFTVLTGQATETSTNLNLTTGK